MTQETSPHPLGMNMCKSVPRALVLHRSGRPATLGRGAPLLHSEPLRRPNLEFHLSGKATDTYSLSLCNRKSMRISMLKR